MPDRPRYMISVAAELVGMYPQTLRLYEAKGLVQPSRTPGGTRLYSDRDVERLRLVQRLTTEVGLNLADFDAVRYLASHGAKPEVWNQPNKQGWTPLTIAEGYRFGNFKPSPPTVAAFLEVMKAAGIAPKDDRKSGISDYVKR